MLTGIALNKKLKVLALPRKLGRTTLDRSYKVLDFTPEEKKVILFILGLAFCGLALNNLIKANCRVEKVVYPQVQLARISLNKVSLAELIRFKCVSQKLAQSIVEYRNLRKEFASLEELKEVKGIGAKRYEKLKELFFVE